jgi:hypothetical protein
MASWKHKAWKTFSGTWYIGGSNLSDFEIALLIKQNPEKYGNLKDWQKVK